MRHLRGVKTFSPDHFTKSLSKPESSLAPHSVGLRCCGSWHTNSHFRDLPKHRRPSFMLVPDTRISHTSPLSFSLFPPSPSLSLLIPPFSLSLSLSLSQSCSCLCLLCFFLESTYKRLSLSPSSSLGRGGVRVPIEGGRTRGGRSLLVLAGVVGLVWGVGDVGGRPNLCGRVPELGLGQGDLLWLL